MHFWHSTIQRTTVCAALALVWACVRTDVASAGTANVPFQVQVTVVSGCTILTNNLSFGNYTSGQAAPVNAQVNFTVNCVSPGNGPKRLAIDQGSFPQAGSTKPSPLRQMALGANRLTYNLYRDAAHTQVFGQVAPADIDVPGPYPQVVPVYGQLAGGQTVPLGFYQDPVTAIVTF